MNSSNWGSNVAILHTIFNFTEPFHPFELIPEVSTFEFITEGIMVTTIGMLGVIANIVSLVILSRPQMRSSINCGLQGLAIFDTIVLLCAVLMLGLNKLGCRLQLLSSYALYVSPFIIPIAYPVGLIAQTGSVWTTVAVTVERYIAVCHPLKAKSLCTYRRARFFNLFITIMAIVYNIPRFWEVEHSEFFAPELNHTVYKIVASQLRVNKLYYEVYHIWLYLLVMYFIPFLILTVFNIYIWHTVRRANRERQTLSRKQEGEFSLAMMLLCVVVVFLTCNILALVINIIEYFDIFLPPLVRVSNLLVTVNSSVNFVIYCIFGRKFKRTFLVLFCKYPIQRASLNDSFQGSTWIRFRTIKSSSLSLNYSVNGNGHCHM
ncbi:FMRFamide receptor-like [Parasteatoda tepidariorum]|uniref:FMRFamide receptor-like n=1 Tax=Parasteatoda tepidariorum TaxID=114398 RepID=UPI00077FABE6|nr:FMRFamide receptor-like [Parasteatoda tepidariorum]